MNATTRSVPANQFGPFRLDRDNRLLLRDERPVPLTPKVFDALLFLVDRSGKLVTKDELMAGLWPGTFVTESNLTQTIFMLRKALGESASEQRYILTVSGRGYRFAGDAKPSVVPKAATAVQETVSHVDKPGVSSNWQVRAAVAIGIAGIAMAALLWNRARTTPSVPRGRVMLAVLPFENLTGDPSQDYFSDGFTEDLIIQAGKLDPKRVGVIAHTSVTNYQGAGKPLAQIGRELNVQYVVEGTIRSVADKVQIAGQLIRVADQRQLWAQKYERSLGDVAGTPATMAKDVENALDGNATSVAGSPTAAAGNYKAYDFLLKARYSMSKRTAASLTQAAEYFRQAVAEDRNNARAYAGLASAYALMASYTLGPQEQFIPKAREAALRAIQLDDQLSEAHTALALIVQNYDWDWTRAEREYRRAIELDPNNATAHQWYAEHLSLRGRFAEAFTEIERARQLDPVSLIIASDHATILFYARQYDESIRQFRAVLDAEPRFIHAYTVLGVYLAQGRVAEAEADIARWRRIENSDWTLLAEGLVDARAGKTREAGRVLAQLQAEDKKQTVDPTMLAAMYKALGKKDEAFASLEKARQQHSIALTTLKVNPGWDSLRSDPRFAELLRSVNLAD